MAVLVAHTGGPAAGRLRALRRLLKTLVADVYVIDRAGAVDGAVAVHYRRSLRYGGLVATIDAMFSLRSQPDERREDLALLAGCALTRARRRGCVEIDACIEAEDARRALQDEGFATGRQRQGRTLRPEEEG